MSLDIHYERIPKVTAGFRNVQIDVREGLNKLGNPTLRASAWVQGKLRVISCVELAEAPDGKGDAIAQWHISITAGGARATERQVRRVLREFGMPRYEEDNHQPGKARHFWCTVDPKRRVDCQCKDDEITIVEPDGYKWQNPEIPNECRGCEHEALWGSPCGLHGKKPAVSPRLAAEDQGPRP